MTAGANVAASELRVLYEDNHVIAVWKPAGLLSQGARSGDDNLLDRVKAWLAVTYDKPGQVFLGLLHRLDRPVAGVMLFARTSKAASRLSAQFRERAIDKVYWAWVEGRVGPAEATLRHLLEARGESERVRVHAAGDPDRIGGVRPSGQSPAEARSPAPGARSWKPATLHYRRLWSDGRSSVLELRLETGRKHQIRAQLAAIGHPVVGDVRYGATRRFSGPGIALVAERLTFTHPVSKLAITVETPPELCPLRRCLPALAALRSD